MEYIKVVSHRPKRKDIIQQDEITDLVILLETTASVTEFLKELCARTGREII